MLKRVSLLILVGWLLQGCSMMSVSTKTTQSLIEEDLSVYRPEVPATENDTSVAVTVEEDVQINLDSLETINDELIMTTFN